MSPLDAEIGRGSNWVTVSMQSCSLRVIANTAINHFGTSDSRELLTPFALRSKNFRPSFLSARFWKSTVKDTEAEGFVACTRALIIRYPDARQSAPMIDPYAQ